ncbi:P-selectin-like, partial [Fundulus heteroclitus]|uniref:P-selectin-like n=1 Tax=Fundulus heteroclitus TaxID=8078 RepID=UPI00165A20F8
MKNRGLSLLMVAGLLSVVDLQSDQTIQQFRYVGLMKNWNDAQAYCRERFSDLATIQNPANNTEARRAAGSSKFWIGLFNGTWKWSQDENELIPTSSSYSNWNFGEPQDWQCVLMSKSGYWFSKDCGELHEFLCYDAPLLRNVLVKQKMSWSDAQSYCRSTYTDLSSIRSSIENTAMYVILWGLPFGSSSWIGLHRSDWVWSDGSISSYTALGLQRSPEQANCV